VLEISALLRLKQRRLPCLQRSPPFFFSLVRLSLSLGFGFCATCLISPFRRLPELFYLSCSYPTLGCLESFLACGELWRPSFGFDLRAALLRSLRRRLPLESVTLGCKLMLIWL
jgi:hypothetical protein